MIYHPQKGKNYRKYSDDISMMYLPLHRAIWGLWVIGVFVRGAKIILFDRVHRDNSEMSNLLDDCGNDTEIDLSPYATYVPNCA